MVEKLPTQDVAVEIPDEIALLPIRDLVVFPFMVVPLFVCRALSVLAVEEALAGERLLFLCAQKNAGADEPGLGELYRVGTVGKILRMRKLPDGQVKVLVQGLRRARFVRAIRERPCLVVQVTAIDEPVQTEQEAVEVEGLVRAVKDSLRGLSDVGKGLPQDVATVLLGLNDPGALADLVASNLGLKVPEAQLVLEAESPVHRLRRVNEVLAKEVEVVAWQQKIQTQAKEEMSRAQREYFLREQLKQIRQELGEIDDKSEEIDALRKRIAEALPPTEVEKEAEKQLRRLEGMNFETAEASVVRTYLEWLADLPWSKLSDDQLDLERAKAILDDDHFGLTAIKDRILEYLAVLALKKNHRGPILCFVGPPGVGKTSLGRSIARALGREFVRISLGGVHDESEIRGHRRTYVGAMPGRIISGLKQAGTRNPVFMLDELDKVGSDVRGDPAAALLEVLDPEQNHSFRDHYLNLPFDLSGVLWLATANMVEPIQPALRDRMEILELAGYDLDEKLEIARRFLIPKQRNECGLCEDDLSVTNAAVEVMIERYTRESGLRSLEKRLAALSRKVARRFAEGKKDRVRVGAKDLEKYLGARQHDPERPDEADRVGLATGLAWTPSGGLILHVEATAMNGKPGLILTGQLGSVMKESAQAALSWTRSRARDFGIDEAVFAEKEIHLHVPHGAVPKDGPSAGITMATSIVSVLAGLPVRRDLAMTGEITLRGRILPIGGLRQKILAATRSGIEHVIVPHANEPDLAEIPIALRRRIEIHLVRELDEVLDLALVGLKRTTPVIEGQAQEVRASHAPVGLA